MFDLLQYTQAIQQMRDELIHVGVKELRTADEVSAILPESKGTTLVFVNSVCGCAAGKARPGFAMSLQNNVVPDHLYTVFAGQDKAATEEARKFFTGYPPSSPSVALLKDGELVGMIERRQIEGRSASDVAQDLKSLYNKFCAQ
ncbi:MAG: BrxA/BrxB family bacilliredoxin [Rhizobacter sp.]|nr:BrxA/BrxB family bacilliredoxin [Chlorobiales bacterium]